MPAEPAFTPLRGSCLCGAVAYELRSPPKAVSHCHCRMCQKAHGAAFASYGSVPLADLVWVRGAQGLRAYTSSPGITRGSCQDCGSPLTWHSQHYAQGSWIAVALGALDSPFQPAKQRHVRPESAPLWHSPAQAIPGADADTDAKADVTAGTPPRAHKACAVVLRGREQPEVLVFAHPLAGVQLPKGSIEAGETAAEAAVRELWEESGLRALGPAQDLGLWASGHQDQVWSLQLCNTAPAPDSWVHRTADDGGHDFRFFWHPLHATAPAHWHPVYRAALAEIAQRLKALGLSPA